MKVTKLTENQLLRLLDESEIISTETFASMLKNEILHPAFGNGFTIQANDGAYLITKKSAKVLDVL